MTPAGKDPRKYTSYSITVSGHRKDERESSMIPANGTVSHAVERFLRDFLKNEKIKVKIDAHDTVVRENV